MIIVIVVIVIVKDPRGGSRILVRGANSCDPRGALNPKFAQNRGFSLKIA